MKIVRLVLGSITTVLEANQFFIYFFIRVILTYLQIRVYVAANSIQMINLHPPSQDYLLVHYKFIDCIFREMLLITITLHPLLRYVENEIK